MKYGKYTTEENEKLGQMWGRGHTGTHIHPQFELLPRAERCISDLGSWTLLFRQPVAALQIQNHQTGEWKWVKPQDATLTVNACDALTLLTGGYVRSTIHRYAP